MFFVKPLMGILGCFTSYVIRVSLNISSHPTFLFCLLSSHQLNSFYLLSPQSTLPHLTSHCLTSPHLTLPPPSPHLTSPHLTSPHLTSPHLNSPHLTSPHLTSPYLNSPHLTSPHLTSPYLTPPYLTSPPPSPHLLFSLHLTSHLRRLPRREYLL